MIKEIKCQLNYPMRQKTKSELDKAENVVGIEEGNSEDIDIAAAIEEEQ